MVSYIDTIVVGGGAVGSAAAWQLARRGGEVAVFDRAAPGQRGSEPPSATSFGLGAPEPLYRHLLAEAVTRWRELEAETGTRLFDEVGMIGHGYDTAFARAARELPDAGFTVETLGPQEAARRWPGMRFDRRVLFTPQGGRIDAVAAVEALRSVARSHGAQLHPLARVTRIRILGDDSAQIDVVPTDAAGEPTADPEPFRCRRLVVALGSETTRLLGAVVVLPRLSVSEERALRFRPLISDPLGPGFTHFPNPGDSRDGYWCAPIAGAHRPDGGVELGWSGPVPRGDGGSRTLRTSRGFTPERRQLAALERYAREWLPGVAPEFLEEIVSTSTTTKDGHFVVDRVGPVAVAAGFSSQGLKFAPVVGHLLAELTEGVRAPSLFSLRQDLRGAALAG
jgi:sarcosine oxidase